MTIEYNKETGEFTKNGKKTGSITTHGYIEIMFNKKRYYAHRLAWFLSYGEWPNIIDHMNGIKTDNRLSNLNSVFHRQNNQNVMYPRINNKSGFLGVYPKKNKKGIVVRYVAQIVINNKAVYLGSFKKPQEAHEKYINEKIKVHYCGCYAHLVDNPYPEHTR